MARSPSRFTLPRELTLGMKREEHHLLMKGYGHEGSQAVSVGWLKNMVTWDKLLHFSEPQFFHLWIMMTQHRELSRDRFYRKLHPQTVRRSMRYRRSDVNGHCYCHSSCRALHASVLGKQHRDIPGGCVGHARQIVPGAANQCRE